MHTIEVQLTLEALGALNSLVPGSRAVWRDQLMPPSCARKVRTALSQALPLSLVSQTVLSTQTITSYLLLGHWYQKLLFYCPWRSRVGSGGPVWMLPQHKGSFRLRLGPGADTQEADRKYTFTALA